METLVWVVEPKSIVVNATFYTDGSFRDGEAQELGREGWAFAAFDGQANATAVAYGVPPLGLKASRGLRLGPFFRLLCVLCQRSPPTGWTAYPS